MLISIAGWLVCFAIGVALQRRLRDPRRASHLIFMTVLWVLSPLVVIYAYTTVVLRPELLAAFACVIVAAWTTLLAGMLWGRFGGRGQRESGVMAFATGMGNSATLGFPLTTLAFGGPGLALAVIYAEFQYLLPTAGVVLGLGRHYAGPDSRGLQVPGLRKLLRSWLVNPPVIAGAAAVDPATARCGHLRGRRHPLDLPSGCRSGSSASCRSASLSRSSPSPTTAATCGGPRPPSPSGAV